MTTNSICNTKYFILSWLLREHLKCAFLPLLVQQSIALLAIIITAIGWKRAFLETYKSHRICARASRVSKKAAEEPTVSLPALLATTVPLMTFRLLLASSVLSCVVAVVASGTELEFVKTRVMLLTTEPLLETEVKQILFFQGMLKIYFYLVRVSDWS